MRARQRKYACAHRVAIDSDRGSERAEKEQAGTALSALETGNHSSRVTIDTLLVLLPCFADCRRAACTLQRLV